MVPGAGRPGEQTGDKSQGHHEVRSGESLPLPWPWPLGGMGCKDPLLRDPQVPSGGPLPLSHLCPPRFAPPREARLTPRVRATSQLSFPSRRRRPRRACCSPGAGSPVFLLTASSCKVRSAGDRARLAGRPAQDQGPAGAVPPPQPRGSARLPRQMAPVETWHAGWPLIPSVCHRT